MIGGMDERAVSDVLAFIIVFSIIITSVALVYGTGFSSIQQVADGEQKANAERAFEAIALSMGDIVEGAAPRRGGSLNLGGGQLRTGDSTTVSINVDGGSYMTTETVGSFEYYIDDTAVAYETGGVFRRDGSASVTVVEPTIQCTSESTIVSLVQVESSQGAIGATGNVEVSMVEQDTTLLYTDDDGTSLNDVTLTVSGTDYAPAWKRTLTDADDSDQSTTRTGSTVTMTCSNTERVVVRIVTIELTYGSP
jgi:hypothetical protein